MKILFIARTYPPFVGGMEKFASDFYGNLNSLADVKLIANPHGKKRIYQFSLKTLLYLVFNAHKYDIIHFNDAVLSPLSVVIRLFSKAKVTFTVHGLDIVFNQNHYQKLIIPFLRKADLIFPVSHYTKEQCIVRQIPERILHVIPNGLVFSEITSCDGVHKSKLLGQHNIDISDKKVLLSLGRLIKRKGHAWFIENVFVRLPNEYIYLIAGDAREYDNIAKLVDSLSLKQRIFMLGYVTEEEKACLFEIADLFVMPNIFIENDQEGFGIVLLEAGSHGVPSIASNIEGIKDAVIDGVTGTLVEEKDVDGFVKAIEQARFEREQIPNILQNQYDWPMLAQTYYQYFLSLMRSRDH